MRTFTLALVICIAVAIGVVAGLTLVRPTGTSLAVATQQREDQIPFPPGAEGVLAGAWEDRPSFTGVLPATVAIDPNKYPPGTTFRLWWAVWVDKNSDACARLANLGDRSPVAGSQFCETKGGFRFGESEPFTLDAGRRGYIIQAVAGRPDKSAFGGNVQVTSWRLIAEWGEPVQVTALPNTGGSDVPSGWALPYGASVAAGALMLGIGGLYVVRMRRQT